MQRFSSLLVVTMFLFFTSPTIYSAEIGNDYLGFWNVELVNGPDYDPITNTTSYVYQISGWGEPGKDLSHWVLPLEEGMGVTTAWVNELPSTTWEVGSDPTTGAYGLKFDDGQPIDETYTYVVVLQGAWNAQPGSVFLKAGHGDFSVAEGETMVPGGGGTVGDTYSIEGVIYVDVNGNGLHDIDEPTLNDVSVLLDGNTPIVSGPDGVYGFDGLAPGSYMISIDDGSSAGFMVNLARYFQPTTTTTQTVSIGPDATGVSFGFAINASAILADLDPEDTDGNGVIITGEGRTIGFWKHQLSVLVKGRGKAQVHQSQMDALIHAVNGFFIADPFALSSYADGIAILGARTSDEFDLLKKQLLGSEFNRFHGLGIHDVALFTILLQVAETMAGNPTNHDRSDVLLMKDVLDTINNLGH